MNALVGGREKVGLIENPDCAPADASSQQTDSQKLLQRLLGLLDERSEQVIRLRFFENVGLKEVGDILGVCKERVRQIENTALKNLRKAAERHNWEFDEDFGDPA